MVKRKVGLGSEAPSRGSQPGRPAESTEVLDLFFDTGIVYHEATLPSELPDIVSSFVVMPTPGPAGGPAASTGPSAPPATFSVRRATPGEEPDVEVSAVDHLGELGNRWLPLPYPFTSPHCVQIFLSARPEGVRALLAIDTLTARVRPGAPPTAGLDPSLDGGRPFRPLGPSEVSGFLDHPETRDLIRKLERGGVDKALFKIAALLETLAPLLPRLRFSRVQDFVPAPVSLVLDFGNSRSAALLVEARDKGLFALPLEVRSSADPFQISEETFDSRITLLPSAFDKAVFPVAVGDGFASPSVARLGREALDRALETPHRYACTLSGPKRYLWDGRDIEDRWHFASKVSSVAHDAEGEYRPIFGRILKYIDDRGGGLALRQDGPSAPPDPRYPPRAMMLFAMVEILGQAYAQINSPRYRAFQGKEQNPRVLKDLVLTFPSAMRDEEKQVYEALVRNAVILTTGLLGIDPAHRPNWSATHGRFEPFLFVDEALAAQMVYLYQEVFGVFSGTMEDFVAVYGKKDGTVRIASIDIGGGTSDVMIAEYRDNVAGAGTSLSIKKLFQDGVGIAGDEVCRAIVEDVVFAQIAAQLPGHAQRAKLLHLFGEGDAGYGAAWRTLRAKLVPYFWLPLARCYWAVAEGFEIPEHTSDKVYSLSELFALFSDPDAGRGAGIGSFSPAIVGEADAFLASVVDEFPGLQNLMFRFDRQAVERCIASVLREPLRRYSDILAQFDVDLLVLAGRTSALPCVRELFVSEMPVPPPRIKTMASYRVGDWYPSKWRTSSARIKDPKSTVAAGATVLFLAAKNRLPGFTLDTIQEVAQQPIYGLYQETEPHIPRANELFREGKASRPVLYTAGMMIGFRNVDSQEMDGSPLFEVRPASPDVEEALLEDRVSLRFALAKDGSIATHSVESQRDKYSFGADDFTLMLKTIREDRYWLDTGIFKGTARYL